MIFRTFFRGFSPPEERSAGGAASTKAAAEMLAEARVLIGPQSLMLRV